VAPSAQPHILGIDDGPVRKFEAPAARAPIVGVMMEGSVLVEGVAVTSFPVDGDEVTEFLGSWIEGLRFRPALHAVLFKGISIAGLGVIDIRGLAKRLGLPAAIVNRREPSNDRLCVALESAGLRDRISLVTDAPRARRIDGELFVSTAGANDEKIVEWILATRAKSDLPEPLRLAHLIARALATGESRGRP
jgi:endonuclease V-like protein UPF0215 family